MVFTQLKIWSAESDSIHLQNEPAVGSAEFSVETAELSADWLKYRIFAEKSAKNSKNLQKNLQKTSKNLQKICRNSVLFGSEQFSDKSAENSAVSTEKSADPTAGSFCRWILSLSADQIFSWVRKAL